MTVSLCAQRAAPSSHPTGQHTVGAQTPCLATNTTAALTEEIIHKQPIYLNIWMQECCYLCKLLLVWCHVTSWNIFPLLSVDLCRWIRLPICGETETYQLLSYYKFIQKTNVIFSWPAPCSLVGHLHNFLPVSIEFAVYVRGQYVQFWWFSFSVPSSTSLWAGLFFFFICHFYLNVDLWEVSCTLQDSCHLQFDFLGKAEKLELVFSPEILIHEDMPLMLQFSARILPFSFKFPVSLSLFIFLPICYRCDC